MKNFGSIFLVLSILAPVITYAKELKPFTSDGCSAFPEGTFKYNQLWLECCTRHDFSYWQGGTFKQRVQADLELQACVSQVGEPEIALLMLAGVRVGGTPFLPTTFRWGYGWSYPSFYHPLSIMEQQKIKNAIDQVEDQSAALKGN